MTRFDPKRFGISRKTIRSAAVIASALLAAALVAGEIEGIIEEAPITLYSGRIVDLSSIDLLHYSGAGYETKIRWLTDPRAGLAMWDSTNEEFVVVPLAQGDSDALVAFGFPPSKVPKPGIRLANLLKPGAHYSCHPSTVSSVEIYVSEQTPLVGRIQFTYSGQGRVINYSGGDQYLF